MRVTGTMQNMQLLYNLRNINSSMVKGQNQLASGQKINRPSDDPIGVGYQMRYDTDLARSDEFLENAKTGSDILKTMDSLLSQASSVMQRARTLALQASNDTYDNKQREVISSEIKQLKEQMVTIGNSTYNGKYLFNGQKTDQPPYTSDGAATENTDQGLFYLNVSPAVKVPVSITGEIVFGEAGTDNVFKVLDDLAAALETNNKDGITASLDKIDTVADKMMLSWAEIGARMNRFDLMVSRIEDEQVNITEQRSEVADVDMPSAITDLKSKETVLQAALSTGARIMQTSLLDFLR
ncbi:flagellar hook-associated protein FlgL [Paenibacillus sp. ACRRY]|uniref:flagellar hook-associated protein FlgL n=1 Tax=Paenibacillus sp. ACRRY TaxID=2918208 RepID=UPI001EF4A169|nr:flagellar hook-associated protein FlgL [Paenibacillus sp. ACRRY]MCG7384093.1 flagellar hook-associated protein FlgL [Paenibacillus sp. ACRRY]